jgi:O-antigen ligase
VELTSAPFGFEILQIEAVSLFFVSMSSLLVTWVAYQDGPAESLDQMRAWVLFAAGTFVVLTGAFVYSLGLPQFVFALLLAFGVMLALLRPVNALAFFICLQFLRPWEVAEENALLLALPRMTGLLAIASAVVAYFRSDLKRLSFGRGQWFLLGFGLWSVLSTIITPSPGDQLKEFFDTFFRALIVFYLIVAVVRKQYDLELMRRVYLWSVTGLAGISMYISWDKLLAEGSGGDRLHAIGILENANDIAAVMVVGVPFALRRLSQSTRRPLVWFESLFFLTLTLLALYLAQSRGALLALGAGAVGWWIVRSRRRWIAIGLGLILVLSVAPFANDLMRRDSQDLEESSTSRLTYWKAGVRMVIRNPLFGVGFGRYPKEYQSNAGEGEQFEFGERTAHSTWILALAETGVPGLMLFLAFVLSVLNMARKIVPHEPDLFVALIAYLIAVSFLSHTYLVYPYILMGLVVAGYRMHFRSEKGWSM